jgi:hypothetical protein
MNSVNRARPVAQPVPIFCSFCGRPANVIDEGSLFLRLRCSHCDRPPNIQVNDPPMPVLPVVGVASSLRGVGATCH